MHGRLNLIARRLVPLCRRRFILHSHWHFCSFGGAVSGKSIESHPDPPWISSNSLFRRHPRLLFLERCSSLHCLNLILAYTIVSGVFHNPFIASRILRSYITISPRTPSLPFSVFSQMSRPNPYSWNSMIKSLAETSAAASLSLFVQMRRSGVSPDNYTVPFLLTSFTSIDDLDYGRSIHAFSLVSGNESSSIFVQTGLLSMYIDCGDQGSALRLFDEMPSKDVVAWTAVISGLNDQGCHEKALAVFSAMRRNGDLVIRPNAATIVSAMAACSCLGSLNHTKTHHSNMLKTGFGNHAFARNSLIDAYGKSGSVSSARQVFDTMTERDLHTWTAMIMGLALNGLGKDAIFIFSQIMREGLVPDSAAFLAILLACSHAGLVDEGISIFKSMEGGFGIRPELKHFGCMIDLLGRAGHLYHAYELVYSMPMEPSLEIVGALLSACRVHGELELVELLSRRIDQCRGGVSVILSNLYANNGQWQEVISIRRGRRKEGGKPPGRSWIEVEGVVQEFLVGDRRHTLTEEIEDTLNGLSKVMEGVL